MIQRLRHTTKSESPLENKTTYQGIATEFSEVNIHLADLGEVTNSGRHFRSGVQ